jgi:Domain of unknown function (DUF1707)
MPSLRIGDLRIGDVERDAAAEALSAHYAAGRLDRVELEERLSATYAAKTGDELQPLLADLPSTAAPSQQRRRVGPPPFPALLVLILVVASIAAISNGYPPVFLLFVLWMWRGRRMHRSWR